MLRVAIVADSHFSERSRFEECVRVHDFIAEEVRRRDVHLVIHTGDVFDARSTPAERAAVVRWVRDVSRTCPLLVIRGNHDAPGDLAILDKLRTACEVRVEERAGVHRIDTRAGKVAVGALAWPQTSNLAAALGEASLEATGLAAGDALRAVIRGIGDELAVCDGVRIFAAHAMVRGSRTSTGQPLVGCDLEIGLDDLALARADAVALGHIHMPQAWDLATLPEFREEARDRVAPVIYPGSPRRTAFGEVEEKGFVLLTIDGSRDRIAEVDVKVERVATPCAPMKLIEATYSPELGLRAGGESFSDFWGGLGGAEVRLRYSVPADQREAAARIADDARGRMIELGAVSVKVEEEVIAETRARAPEVSLARGIEAKLRAYYARRPDVAPDRIERLITKARELEAA